MDIQWNIQWNTQWESSSVTRSQKQIEPFAHLFVTHKTHKTHGHTMEHTMEHTMGIQQRN